MNKIYACDLDARNAEFVNDGTYKFPLKPHKSVNAWVDMDTGETYVEINRMKEDLFLRAEVPPLELAILRGRLKREMKKD